MPIALILGLAQLVPGIIAALQTARQSTDLTPEQRAQIDAALDSANAALQAS